MSKKVKQNRYKPEPGKPMPERVGGWGKQTWRFLAVPALVCILSLGAIYAHDAVVQSPFFLIESVEISGEKRVKRSEILTLAGLEAPRNIFRINCYTLEKRIATHPWIAEASVRRFLFSTLRISVTEEEPLAIVNIENLSDVLINTQGKPFKEYDPARDDVESLPVISGVDLTRADTGFRFDGPLFNSILDLLNEKRLADIMTVTGDDNTGVTIKTRDVYNREPQIPMESIPLILGFDRFREKFVQARKISQYIHANLPGKTIITMDLFNIDKVFVKTADTETLHNNLEKGV